jgi:hypothetical protein
MIAWLLDGRVKIQASVLLVGCIYLYCDAHCGACWRGAAHGKCNAGTHHQAAVYNSLSQLLSATVAATPSILWDPAEPTAVPCMPSASAAVGSTGIVRQIVLLSYSWPWLAAAAAAASEHVLFTLTLPRQ